MDNNFLVITNRYFCLSNRYLAGIQTTPGLQLQSGNTRLRHRVFIGSCAISRKTAFFPVFYRF